MLGWLKNHWKVFAVGAIATVAFVAVTAATGGLAAPLLATLGASALATPLSLAAGGFASGVVGYVANRWLSHEKATVGDALKQGAISTVVTLATLGAGRLLAPVLEPLVPEAVAALPAAVKVSAGNALAGSLLGAGTQAASNAITHRPLTENLDVATAVGGFDGLLLAPARALVPTPVLRAPEPDPVPGPAARTGGIASLLEAKPSLAPPLARVNPLADTRPYLEQSPSLAKALNYLVPRGWTIRYGDPSSGTFTNRSQKVIQIASDHATPEDVAQAIAHEVGHALDARMRPVFASATDRGRFELESEGKAALFNTRVRDEIYASTGIDIGVNGDAVGPVSEIARDPSLTETQKIQKIGEVFAKAHPSGTPDKTTYELYYGARNRTAEQLSGFVRKIAGYIARM